MNKKTLLLIGGIVLFFGLAACACGIFVVLVLRSANRDDNAQSYETKTGYTIPASA